MGIILDLPDLNPFIDVSNKVKVLEMITDVEARALQVAPCLADPEFRHGAVAKAILRQAVIRWSEAGSGAVVQRQQTAGPFSEGMSFDNRSERKALLWPSEIADLAALCRDGQGARKATTRWLV